MDPQARLNDSSTLPPGEPMDMSPTPAAVPVQQKSSQPPRKFILGPMEMPKDIVPPRYRDRINVQRHLRLQVEKRLVKTLEAMAAGPGPFADSPEAEAGKKMRAKEVEKKFPWTSEKSWKGARTFNKYPAWLEAWDDHDARVPRSLSTLHDPHHWRSSFKNYQDPTSGALRKKKED